MASLQILLPELLPRSLARARMKRIVASIRPNSLPHALFVHSHVYTQVEVKHSHGMLTQDIRHGIFPLLSIRRRQDEFNIIPVHLSNPVQRSQSLCQGPGIEADITGRQANVFHLVYMERILPERDEFRGLFAYPSPAQVWSDQAVVVSFVCAGLIPILRCAVVLDQQISCRVGEWWDTPRLESDARLVICPQPRDISRPPVITWWNKIAAFWDLYLRNLIALSR